MIFEALTTENTHFNEEMGKDTFFISDPESFFERICKENLWSLDYTKRVFQEYKKFIYLGTLIPVAPSKDIDVVWHAHLLYTKDYKDMCEKLGLNFFHHNPKPSKKVPGTMERDEYQDTKDWYLRIFKTFPPKDVWADWKESHYVNINLKEYWVIPIGEWKTLVKLFFKNLIS